jgi:hypothetical protein
LLHLTQSKWRNTALAGFALAAVTLDASHSVANAAGFEILRPHRAVYEIALDKATDRSGITNMTGRIVYEMSGNECDGISVRYRFVSNVTANGEIFTTDQQTASFESPDGKQYTFLTKSFVNDQLDRTIKGVAENEKNEVVVKLDQPEERVINLPKANFISSHLVKVIDNARSGNNFFTTDVFDGGDSADEVLKTTNVIGKPKTVEETFPGEEAKALTALSKEQAWPVTIGYYEESQPNATESVPIYEVSFLLYEGGISRKLVMNYPDYSITGTLVSLEMLDDQTCKMEN